MSVTEQNLIRLTAAGPFDLCRPGECIRVLSAAPETHQGIPAVTPCITHNPVRADAHGAPQRQGYDGYLHLEVLSCRRERLFTGLVDLGRAGIRGRVAAYYLAFGGRNTVQAELVL